MHAPLPRHLPLVVRLRLQRMLDTTARSWGLQQQCARRATAHLGFAISY